MCLSILAISAPSLQVGSTTSALDQFAPRMLSLPGSRSMAYCGSCAQYTDTKWSRQRFSCGVSLLQMGLLISNAIPSLHGLVTFTTPTTQTLYPLATPNRYRPQHRICISGVTFTGNVALPASDLSFPGGARPPTYPGSSTRSSFNSSLLRV